MEYEAGQIFKDGKHYIKLIEIRGGMYHLSRQYLTREEAEKATAVYGVVNRYGIAHIGKVESDTVEVEDTKPKRILVDAEVQTKKKKAGSKTSKK